MNQLQNQLNNRADHRNRLTDKPAFLKCEHRGSRAGEHGRGFSVVASEIQQLSEQSNRAAGEIQNMISNLNTNATHTLDRVKAVQHIIENKKKTSRKPVRSSTRSAITSISPPPAWTR